MTDSILEDKDEAYPCDCGGSISRNQNSGEWECDSCDEERWKTTMNTNTQTIKWIDNHAKAIKDLLPKADLEPYRGKPSSYWVVK